MSSPPFSTKQLRIIIVSSAILGIFLCGLGVGEIFQIWNKDIGITAYIAIIFYILGSSIFLLVIVRTVQSIQDVQLK